MAIKHKNTSTYIPIRELESCADKHEEKPAVWYPIDSSGTFAGCGNPGDGTDAE